MAVFPVRFHPVVVWRLGVCMCAQRPALVIVVGFCLALLCFSSGGWFAQRTMENQITANNERIAALHDEIALNILQIRQAQTTRPLGTDGQPTTGVAMSGSAQSALVEEIKHQLQSEMGLLPVRLLRQ